MKMKTEVYVYNYIERFSSNGSQVTWRDKNVYIFVPWCSIFCFLLVLNFNWMGNSGFIA